MTAVAQAGYQVLTPGPPAATFGSVSDWMRDLLFLAYLVSAMAAVVGLRRSRVAPTIPAALVVAGYGLLALAVAAGLALQDDPDWFFLLGAPGNLLGALGFVALAVLAWRRRTLAPWAALLCGVGGLLAVALAEFGTSVLIGCFWLAVAGRSPGDEQAAEVRRHRAGPADSGEPQR